MSATLSGVIHGRTIQLDRDAGLPDGARVDISLTAASPAPPENVRAAIGGWLTETSDEAEFQAWLTETYRLREGADRDIVP